MSSRTYNGSSRPTPGRTAPDTARFRYRPTIPGVITAQLLGAPFSTVFNLAKTDWLITLDGVSWERDFLAGSAMAAGRWEDIMDYVQRYIDIGMLYTDPEDRRDADVIRDYLRSHQDYPGQ